VRAWKAAVVLLIGALAAVVFYGRYELRRGFSTRSEPSSFETLLAKTAREMALPPEYRTLQNPFPMSPGNVRAGMEHFAITARFVMQTTAVETHGSEKTCIQNLRTCAGLKRKANRTANSTTPFKMASASVACLLSARTTEQPTPIPGGWCSSFIICRN
jgi:hypothetical protein